MDLTTFIILLLALVVLVVLFRYVFFKAPKKVHVRDAEIKALNHILAGEKEQALKILIEIGHRNTSNLSVFLQVGDLYRQLGNPEAAIRVHQDVLERTDLSQDVILMTHKRLAMDYEALQQYSKATRQVEEILRVNRKDLWSLQALHRFAVKQKKWPLAIKAYQKEQAAGGTADSLLPAIYKTQEAIEAKQTGNLSTAVTLLKQAIKLNSKCAAPYYQLGRIRQAEGNLKHAIDFLTTFAELDPTSGSIVYAEIEKMYFELGQFEQVEQFYQRLHRKQPDNLEAVIGLANYFERKGEYRDALSLLEEVKEPDYTNLSFVIGHLNLLDKLGHKDALKSTINDFITTDRRQRILTCPNCGKVSDEPCYICDECAWVKQT